MLYYINLPPFYYFVGNKIQYVHTSEDEIKMDSFEFEVTDGFNPVYRSFRISISDVDNKKPVVTMSTLRLKEGDSKLITPFELKGNLTTLSSDNSCMVPKLSDLLIVMNFS